MSINRTAPDYELDDIRIVESERELKAMAHRIRDTILDLLLERAATVAELSVAVGRPKSTVAYHVGVLLDADLLRVVRTRRVRAIDQRWYGRTARLFYVGDISGTGIEPERDFANLLGVAGREAQPAHEDDRLRAFVRHARIPRESAAEFWDRVMELALDFAARPRGGDTVYGFAAGLYPTAYPSLPDAEPDAEPDSEEDRAR
jgi:DNA-binding transcriptional ArsR family regulator